MKFGIQPNTTRNRILAGFLALCLLTLSACATPRAKPTPSLQTRGGTYGMHAAVLYDASQEGKGWQETLGYLQQSTLVNLEVSALPIGQDVSLDTYDILYLDSSLAKANQSVTKHIVDYTAAGGTVVLDNSLYGLFDKSFLGASDFVPVTSCPVTPKFPDLGDDLGEVQGILEDFTKLYPSFADYPALKDQNYGVAMVCDTALALAKWEGNGLYTVNQYQQGLVFFTNPILPNYFSLSGFTMEPLSEAQLPFSNTTASCNQLLYNAFAAYVAKQRYGYYLGRVFGSYGSPNMAWELHYEEITGIANNSMKIFSELCQEFLQIPSYVLIRNSYWWFLRSESVSYYLNESKGKDLSYSLNWEENAYSSGTHIASENQWLSLGSIKEGGSYFVDYPEFTLRAYPELYDYNKDGISDLFCGSSDGKLYYYEGSGYSDRLHVSKAHVLTDAKQNPLSVGTYSAPNLCDVNGDGFSDIISGAADGNLYWFAGNGSLQFEPKGILLDTDIKGQTLPSVGDLNHDGLVDLAVGSNESILLVFYGSKQAGGSLSFDRRNMDSLSHRCANAGLGTFLAPEIYDRDQDGKQELAVGTFDGYVALFNEGKNAKQEFTEFLTTQEMNYKGNHNIKTGNNCVPVFYDLNGDKKADLVCGSLEYGMAYPIDSKYFPYQNEVREQLAYAREHEYYMGVHFYTNAYASVEREAFELKRHREAMESYGADLTGAGANQHTWFTSTLAPAQSQRSLWEAGLLWNSGFTPQGSTFRAPQAAAENVIPLPFFLKDGEEETILIQNCSVLPYCGTEWTDLTGKYGVPVCVYYHCDFVYESDEEARNYLQQVSDFQNKHHYNFVKEDQLMKATAAAYNLRVSAEGEVKQGAVHLTLSPEEIGKDFKLYHKDYQNAVGLKLVFREDIDPSTLSVDADVWRVDGQSLYLGLNRTVSMQQGEQAKTPHVARVNVPAEIKVSADGAELRFLEGGMMQVVVAGSADTSSEDWTRTEQDGQTMFTKYGSADNLRLIWKS